MPPVEAESILWTGVHDVRILLRYRILWHLETHGGNGEYVNHVLEIDRPGLGRLKCHSTWSMPLDPAVNIVHSNTNVANMQHAWQPSCPISSFD